MLSALQKRFAVPGPPQLPPPRLAYEIFSCYETSANSNTYTIGFASQPDGRYEQFVHTLKNSSAYDTGIEVSKNDRVITLSTCTKRSIDNRMSLRKVRFIQCLYENAACAVLISAEGMLQIILIILPMHQRVADLRTSVNNASCFTTLEQT